MKKFKIIRFIKTSISALFIAIASMMFMFIVEETACFAGGFNNEYEILFLIAAIIILIVGLLLLESVNIEADDMEEALIEIYANDASQSEYDSEENFYEEE